MKLLIVLVALVASVAAVSLSRENIEPLSEEHVEYSTYCSRMELSSFPVGLQLRFDVISNWKVYLIFLITFLLPFFTHSQLAEHFMEGWPQLQGPLNSRREKTLRNHLEKRWQWNEQIPRLEGDRPEPADQFRRQREVAWMCGDDKPHTRPRKLWKSVSVHSGIFKNEDTRYSFFSKLIQFNLAAFCFRLLGGLYFPFLLFVRP